jgi:foldase protein PrsA
MVRRAKWRLFVLVLPICCMGLAACGAGGSDSVVVRIGGTAITKTMLDHWISVMNAGGAASSDPARQRDRALQYLISSEWLIDESASRGLTASEQEVRQQVAARQAASGGGVEFHKFLASTHRSVADVELEARVELASSRLRQLVAGTAGNVTSMQIATYYKRHRQLFITPERRVAKYAGRHSIAAAEALKRAVESGKRDLTSVAQRNVGEETMTVSSLPNQHDPIESVIYAAKPNVVAMSGKIHGDYYLIQVVRVFPPVAQPLVQVAGTIRGRLVEEAQRRALATFVKAWRAKWIARTGCRPGYVVQKCSQYDGPEAPEDPLTLN